MEGDPGRWARLTRWVALLVVVGGTFLVEGRSIVVFRSLAPWSSPSRIHYCGRDFDRAATVTAEAAKHDGEAASFQTLTHGPLWQPIYGHRATPPGGNGLHTSCAMALFMRDGAGYVEYEISGGP